MKKVKLFGKNFNNIDMKEAINLISTAIENKNKMNIHTVNVDHLILAKKNIQFENYMSNAEIVLADGMPIVWYSKLIQKPLKGRVTGVDLTENIMRISKNENYKIFLLGGAPGVAELCVKNMTKKHGELNIVGTYSPSSMEISNPEKSHVIVEKINSSGANILLVALGAPKQELWINQYKQDLNTNINIGVGATFDFLSGNIKRANIMLQKIGLEWFHRMLTDPKRLIKRYLINDSYFVILCLKHFIKDSK